MSTRDDKMVGMKALFNPRSIAVVGASQDILVNPGGRLVSTLQRYGFKEIYPVNPRRSEVLGIKCYPSVEAIPSSVDLACIAVPTGAVLQVLAECARKGIKAAIIPTAGFGESGMQGKEMERAIKRIVDQEGILVCGPNCLGIISTVTNLYASFTYALDVTPIVGEIGLVSQSGALAAGILTRMTDRGVGISYWISSGNEVDLEMADYVKYLVQDPLTKTIIIFLEGVRNGRSFIEAAESAVRARKPIVAFKTGRSEKGRLSAASHTGSLAGSDKIYDGLFRQYGIIRAYNVDELVDLAMALAWQPLPKGNRVGVISTSGGACSIIADNCEDVGLAVPDLAESTMASLAQLVPPTVTVKNPLDTDWAPQESHEKIIETMSSDPNVDMILMSVAATIGPLGYTLAEAIVKAAKKANTIGKPCFVSWIPSLTYVKDAAKLMIQSRIPLHTTPQAAVRSARATFEYASFLSKRAGQARS